MKKVLMNPGCIILFTMCLLVTSCDDVYQEELIEDRLKPTFTSYSPGSLLDSLTQVFLDSADCTNCLNEVFIDKVYDDEVIFTFIARIPDRKVFSDYSPPLMYFTLRGKTIFVYTGAESFIIAEQYAKNPFPISYDSAGINYLRLQFRLGSDSLSLVDPPSFPFFPRIIPAPPIDSIDSQFFYLAK